jgi:hypothetical protein
MELLRVMDTVYLEVCSFRMQYHTAQRLMGKQNHTNFMCDSEVTKLERKDLPFCQLEIFKMRVTKTLSL